jgi:hypothetical protein
MYDKLKTTQVGQIGVLLVMADLIRHGFEVAVPVNDMGFDLLVSEGSDYWRLQVKSHYNPKRNLVRTRRSRVSGKQRPYDKDVVDAFAFICLKTGDVQVASIGDLEGRTGITITSDLLASIDTLREIDPH